jgi:hypothetical protein
MLANFRKIAFVLQCIEENRNVEHLTSNKEILRKVIFYYAEAEHQFGGEWTCDIVECNHKGGGPRICYEKSTRYYIEEINRMSRAVDDFKLLYHPFCFCRSDP